MGRRVTLNHLPDGGHCPGCGAPLKRVHRHVLDRFISLFRSVHRYRCSNPECDWRGVVGREGATEPQATALTWPKRLTWLMGGVVLATAGMGMVSLFISPKQAPAPKRVAAVSPRPPLEDETFAEYLVPGLQDDGVELSQADARHAKNTTPLKLRRNCVWGEPGRTPYRGTVEQALKASQLLPPEVVSRISQMAENGFASGRLEISNTAIRSADGRRVFKPRIPAMAFGDTMCFETQVNFAPRHVEYAALYEADDRSGKTYSVMVPFVCNNASVLGVRATADAPPPPSVPEPATWLNIGLALGLLAWLRRRAHKEHR